MMRMFSARRLVAYAGSIAIGGAAGVRLGQYFLGDQPLTNLASFKTAEADSKRGMHGGMDKDSGRGQDY